MNARIPLPDMNILPLEIKEIVQAFPLNIFLMTANAPASFKSLAEFARSILFESKFDPRKREIAVLRVAHVTRSIYEWTHHVTLAKLMGLTESDEALTQILDRYGVRGATELILCVSYFNFLSRFLESTRVELEEESTFEKIHKSY
jgi:alkylhydroperoxidase family enzyme